MPSSIDLVTLSPIGHICSAPPLPSPRLPPSSSILLWVVSSVYYNSPYITTTTTTTMASFLRGSVKPVRKKISAATLEAAEKAKVRTRLYLKRKSRHSSTNNNPTVCIIPQMQSKMTPDLTPSPTLTSLYLLLRFLPPPVLLMHVIKSTNQFHARV